MNNIHLFYHLYPNDLVASKFDVSVDVSTISTGNNTKDKHARGDSWFDAETFPKIYFESERFEKRSDEVFEVVGKLKLKGIEKQVRIPFQFEKSGGSATFKGTLQEIGKILVLREIF